MGHAGRVLSAKERNKLAHIVVRGGGVSGEGIPASLEGDTALLHCRLGEEYKPGADWDRSGGGLLIHLLRKHEGVVLYAQMAGQLKALGK